MSYDKDNLVIGTLISYIIITPALLFIYIIGQTFVRKSTSVSSFSLWFPVKGEIEKEMECLNDLYPLAFSNALRVEASFHSLAYLLIS